MPLQWYEWRANRLTPEQEGDPEAEAKREFNLRILAEKKPYFMRYIYPVLMKEYNTYQKAAKAKCLLQTGRRLSELLDADPESLSDDEQEFLRYYRKNLPVHMGNCVMNRICHMFEQRFDREIRNEVVDSGFDPAILRGEAPAYSKNQYYAMRDLLRTYQDDMKRLRQRLAADRRSGAEEEALEEAAGLNRLFRVEASAIASNEAQMCNLIIDLCYRTEGTKSLAWTLCGDIIFGNLLRAGCGELWYPAQDEHGDIVYGGMRFSMRCKVSEYWMRDLMEGNEDEQGDDSAE